MMHKNDMTHSLFSVGPAWCNASTFAESGFTLSFDIRRTHGSISCFAKIDFALLTMFALPLQFFLKSLE